MKTFTPRDYQENGISDIHKFWRGGGLHCILQAPTGTGKTVIFSELARRTVLNGKKVLILTDRAELLQQAGGSLKRVGLDAMYIQAGAKVVSKTKNCYVAMSQTLKRRYKLKHWIGFLKTIDLLIIDEAHKQEFNYIFLSGIFDKKHVIGFTATPERKGKMRQLGLDYERIILTISIPEAIERGYLVNEDYFEFVPPDVGGVEIDRLTGDYKASDLFKKYNNPTTYKGAVKNYKEHTPNTKAICFCINIEHCIRTAIEFNDAGISAKFIVSKVSPPKLKKPDNLGSVSQYNERKKVYDLYQKHKHLTGERKQLFSDFKNDKFLILINVGIATTGYDEPTLLTGIVLRATLSNALWKQMRGRLSRPILDSDFNPSDIKTHFNTLDFGGNAKRLSHYKEFERWALWHKESKGEGLPPIKECGLDSGGEPIKSNGQNGCKRPILASYKICPFCGFKYPDKKIIEVELSCTIFDTETKQAIKTPKIKDMTDIQLFEYWKEKGHKTAWLWRQLWYRGREKSITNFGRVHGWKSGTIRKAISFMK